jgi:hypothetical protein
MSGKAAKKEDKTVLTEILGLKNGEGDDKTLSKDPQNQKVQEKFDAALNDAFNSSLDDLDFLQLGSDDQTPDVNFESSNEGSINLNMDDDGSDLNFGEESNPKLNLTGSNAKEVEPTSSNESLDISFGDDGLDLSSIDQSEFDELTKKTQVANLKDLDFFKKEPTKKVEEVSATLPDITNDEFNLDFSTTGDLIGSDDSKASIEKTIKDIVAPKDVTGEFNLDDLTSDPTTDNITSPNTSPATELDLNFGAEEAEPTREFAYNKGTSSTDSEIINQEVSFNDDALIDQAVNTENEEKTQPAHDLASMVEEDLLSDGLNVDNVHSAPEVVKTKAASTENKLNKNTNEDNYIRREVDDDEYIRLQATIRQLREEREDILSNIKDLKIELKEYETDNLTMKAALDEAKIEVAIMRKRHLTEVEDFKFRLTMAEEKRALAEEKMRNLEKIKERLEQKARIDISQVRQREKELESKLELMAMDVDSQVHSRDQKILELRRKIDALEFNMENASIREQKSSDDKRKLEDKLNKIMKTLRNSIKNLEDDIEESTADILRSEKEK